MIAVWGPDQALGLRSGILLDRDGGSHRWPRSDPTNRKTYVLVEFHGDVLNRTLQRFGQCVGPTVGLNRGISAFHTLLAKNAA
jgi:hypothetical protein